MSKLYSVTFCVTFRVTACVTPCVTLLVRTAALVLGTGADTGRQVKNTGRGTENDME